MNGNTEFLNYIYQNAEMGVQTITQLLDITDDEAFKKQLESQRDTYNAFHDEAKKLLDKHGCDEKGLSTLSEIRTYLMINMQTLTDKSTTHIAEMMIVGSTMGIIQAIRRLREYDGAEKDLTDFMHRLLKQEEKNIEDLKKFI